MLSVDYDAVVSAFVSLLREEIAEPTLLLAHSMGASIAWRVAELARSLVAGVVGVAPAPPGNLCGCAEVVSDDGQRIVLRHPDVDAEIEVSRDQPFVTSDAFVDGQWIAPSSQFPREYADVFRHTVLPMPPRLALQRLGAEGGIPPVANTAAYQGLWVRVLAATNDPAHTPEQKRALVELMHTWGSDAKLVALADRGIVGNGHFMFLERNSDDVLQVVLDEVASSSGS